MASSFEVTTPSTAVAAAHGQPARITVTVTNLLGRQVQAVARVLTTPAVDWVTLAEPAERALAMGEAHQYPLDVVVPAGTPDSTVTVRLAVADKDNPDDVGGESAPVTVRVTGGGGGGGSAPPGYLVACAGAFVGAIVGGLILLAVARVVGVGGSGGDSIGETIAEGVIAALLAVLLIGFGGYVGSVVGCGVALKIGKYRGAGLTALLHAVLLPIWGALIAFVSDLLNVTETLLPVVLAIVVALPPLASRALVVRRTVPAVPERRA